MKDFEKAEEDKEEEEKIRVEVVFFLRALFVPSKTRF